jgi:hypothetical protein
MFGVECLTLKAHQILKGEFNIFLVFGVTCPSKGLLTGIT